MFATLFVLASVLSGIGHATGPSGSTECQLKDDDCDTKIDEDTGTASDDQDADGRIDEDPVDGIDNDGDLKIDEDWPDDDGDGKVDEDPPGDALNDPGENQVDCNEANSKGANGVNVYAGPNGAEVCDDGGTTPIDGRVVVDANSKSVSVDGDNSNPGQSTGYVRVDQGGIHCGSPDNEDSTNPDQSKNTQADCAS
jgi:hypothetical protein